MQANKRPIALPVAGALLSLSTTAVQAAPSAAPAGPPRSLQLIANSATTYDSNLFRIPKEQDPATVIGTTDKSVISETAVAGLVLDKTYSLQRWTGTATYTRNWYQDFSYLNFSATNFDLTWNWQITPHVVGQLTGVRTERLADFDVNRNYSQRNVFRTGVYRAGIDANPIGGWHVLGGAIAVSSYSSLFDSATPTYRQFGGDAGFGYDFLSGSQLRLTGKRTRGQYSSNNIALFAANTDFSETQGQLSIKSDKFGRTTYALNMGYVARHHDRVPARDFSGPIGDADLTWSATGKLSLSLKSSREYVSFQDPFNSYFIRQGVALTPKFFFSEQLNVSGSAGISQMEFRGAPGPTVVPRNDLTSVYKLGVEWTPRYYLRVAADGVARHRSSSYAPQSLDYTSRAVTLTVTVGY